jgi:hypothetical protein
MSGVVAVSPSAMVRNNRTEVRVTPDEGGFEVRFGGGDEATFRFLVGSLKRQLPPFARRYDTAGRCWRIGPRRPMTSKRG